MERLLTAKQVSDLLGVKEFTLYTWRKRNVGPDYIKLDGGRAVRYPESAVEKFIESSTQSKDEE